MDLQNKYLKYKNKYLNLKNQLGGAAAQPQITDEELERIKEIAFAEDDEMVEVEITPNKTEDELRAQLELKIENFKKSINENLENDERNILIFEEKTRSMFEIILGLLQYCQRLLLLDSSKFYVIRLENYTIIQFQLLKIIRNELNSMGYNSFFIRWDKTRVTVLDPVLHEKYLDEIENNISYGYYVKPEINPYVNKKSDRKDLWLCFGKSKHEYSYSKPKIQDVFINDGRNYTRGQGKIEINFFNPDGSINADLSIIREIRNRKVTFNLYSIPVELSDHIQTILDAVPPMIDKDLLELFNTNTQKLSFKQNFLRLFPILEIHMWGGDVINLRFEWINYITDDNIRRLLAIYYPLIFIDPQAFHLQILGQETDIENVHLKIPIEPYIIANKNNKPKLIAVYNEEKEDPMQQLEAILNVNFEIARKKISEKDYALIEQLYKILLT